MKRLSTKLKGQTIASVAATLVAVIMAGQAGFTEGVTVEAGWFAAIVGGTGTLLLALGYRISEKNPPPSAIDQLRKEGLLNKDGIDRLVAAGRLKR